MQLCLNWSVLNSKIIDQSALCQLDTVCPLCVAEDIEDCSVSLDLEKPLFLRLN